LNLEELEKTIGYTFKDKAMLEEALTHKSFKSGKNYERLEFLGDAVLDLIVGEYLFRKFSNLDEGKLSKMRASLVNEDGFEKLAKHINLGKYIFMSLAEENNNGRNKPSLLSSAFEALIGALYLEAGLEKTKQMVINLIDKVYTKVDLKTLSKDYKTSLQEITQALFGIIPEYKLIASYGPDHNKEFKISVIVNGKELAIARGASKKKAEQEAAKIALNVLKNQKDENER